MTVTQHSAERSAERERLARRIVRGLDLYSERGTEIVRLDEDLYRVPSATGEDTSYDVSIEAGKEDCACRDFEIRRTACKHVYAALVADAKLQRSCRPSEALAEKHEALWGERMRGIESWTWKPGVV